MQSAGWANPKEAVISAMKEYTSLGGKHIADSERGRVVDEIKAMLEKPTVIYERFRRIFNEYCQKVLNHEGIFFFYVNSNNNLDYEISLGLAGQTGAVSSQGDGTSYKKIVCALFDLSKVGPAHNLSRGRSGPVGRPSR